MSTQEVFWDYFMATGKIGAYLIFREMNFQEVYTTLASAEEERRSSWGDN